MFPCILGQWYKAKHHKCICHQLYQLINYYINVKYKKRMGEEAMKKLNLHNVKRDCIISYIHTYFASFHNIIIYYQGNYLE